MHTYMIFGTYACNEKADVVGVVVGTLSLFLFFLGGVGYSEPRLEMDGGWKRGRGERRWKINERERNGKRERERERERRKKKLFWLSL